MVSKYYSTRQLFHIFRIFTFIFFISSCESDDDGDVQQEEVIVSGEADFSNFVSVGNSLTAGFTDNALFIKGQKNSLPNLLARQFSLANGGSFTQPLMADNIGGATLGGNIILSPRLIFDGRGPSLLQAQPTTEIANVQAGPYNNMGVPGAKSFHLLVNGYGNIAGLSTGQANPYFIRMASSPQASVIEDAVAQNPTFFSLWIGANDVLGYALTGGDGTDPITDLSLFSQSYTAIVNTLSTEANKGIVFNLPDVTKIPYFTTVPFQPLDPTNPDFGPQIPVLNQQFALLNQVFLALNAPERQIVFNTDAASSVVIRDETLADLTSNIAQILEANGLDPVTAGLFGLLYGQARQSTAEDLMVLPSSTIIGEINENAVEQMMLLGVPEETANQLAVNGITFPMEDQWILVPEEQQEIKTATENFNTVIENAISQRDLVLVDTASILDEITTTGVQFDSYLMKDDLVFGGSFSLDGVHLTARGYALLANEAILKINENYGSNLPLLSAEDYPVLYGTSIP